MQKLKTKRKKKMLRQNNVRIYYGPPGNKDLYWDCKGRNATTDVTLSGKVIHALNGNKGLTIGCHLSNCVHDKENRSALGYQTKIVAVTKSKMFAVTKLKGTKGECLIYEHSYGSLVDLNDTRKSNAFIKKNPDFFEREFTFRAPRYRDEPKTGGSGRTVGTSETSRHVRQDIGAPNGALLRAIKAGLIDRPVGKWLKEHTTATELPT